MQPMNKTLLPLLLALALAWSLGACKSQDDGAVLQTSGETRPDATADGLSFTDTDQRTGYLAGTITIDAAEDESGFESYVLYWGASATEKASDQEALATKDKLGADLTHDLSATATPSGATHFLVYTANDAGESETPVALAISDNGQASENRFGLAIFGTGVFGP